MNEPQLPSWKMQFIEKYVSEWVFVDDNKLLWKNEAPSPQEMFDFLATALEEQKQDYVRQVEGMKLDHTPVTHRIDAYNDAIIDVLAILNGKGTE